MVFKEPLIEWQQAGKCLTETRNESILNNKNLMKRKQHIDKAKKGTKADRWREKCVNRVGKTKRRHNKAKTAKIKSIKH